MKKFIAVAVYCLPLLAFAQPGKGTVLLSGNVSFSKSSDDQPSSLTTVQTDFNAYAGYFVSPRVAVGLTGNFTTYKYTQQSSTVNGKNVSRQNNYGVGPFVRYYVPITERFFFFAEGAAGYTGRTNKSTDADPSIAPTKTTNSGVSITARPGISYFIAKRWAVELMMGAITYTNSKAEANGQTVNSDSFRFNFITRSLAPAILFTF